MKFPNNFKCKTVVDNKANCVKQSWAKPRTSVVSCTTENASKTGKTNCYFEETKCRVQSCSHGHAMFRPNKLYKRLDKQDRKEKIKCLYKPSLKHP